MIKAKHLLKGQTNSRQRFLLPLFIIVCLCSALGINAFYSRFAFVVIPCLSFIIFFYPLPGLAYIVATQYLPDYSMNPILTDAQFVFIGFLMHVVFRQFKGAKVFLPPKYIMIYWAPFVLWITICAIGYQDFSFLAQMVKGLFFSFIAYDIFMRSGCSQRRTAIALAAGFACAGIFYWAYHFGIAPAFSSKTIVAQFGNMVRGAARISAGRADANTSGASIGAALGAFVILIIGAFFERIKRNRIHLFFLLFTILLILVPPLLGSMSRGAILQCFVVITAIFIYMLIVKRGNIDRKVIKLASLTVALLGALVFFTQTPIFNNVMFRLNNLYEFYQQQGGGLADRGRTFERASILVIDNPIFGISSEAEFLHLGKESHNTYLDAGLRGGIPGFIFFFLAMFVPFYKCWEDRKRQVVEPALIGLYLAWAVTAANLSIIGNKAIWVTWILLMTVTSNLRISPRKRFRESMESVGMNVVKSVRESS